MSKNNLIFGPTGGNLLTLVRAIPPSNEDTSMDPIATDSIRTPSSLDSIRMSNQALSTDPIHTSNQDAMRASQTDHLTHTQSQTTIQTDQWSCAVTERGRRRIIRSI